MFRDVWHAPPASPSYDNLTCADYLAIAILLRILCIIMKVLIIRIQLNPYTARWGSRSIRRTCRLVFSPTLPIGIDWCLARIQIVLA